MHELSYRSVLNADQNLLFLCSPMLKVLKEKMES